RATFQEIDTGESVSGSAIGSGYRQFLINKGIDYFLDRPIFGYGLNQYRPKFGKEIGKFTYSHNTWVELLVGFGLVITLIYLAIYLRLFKKIYYRFGSDRRSIYLFLGTALISVLIV